MEIEMENCWKADKTNEEVPFPLLSLRGWAVRVIYF